MKRKRIKVDFSTIMYLSKVYQEEYNERELCLSVEQNKASFRDFVGQYYSAQYWGTKVSPTIMPDIPLF